MDIIVNGSVIVIVVNRLYRPRIKIIQIQLLLDFLVI